MPVHLFPKTILVPHLQEFSSTTRIFSFQADFCVDGKCPASDEMIGPLNFLGCHDNQVEADHTHLHKLYVVTETEMTDFQNTLFLLSLSVTVC